MGIKPVRCQLRNLICTLCLCQVYATITSLEHGSYSTDAQELNRDCPVSCLPGYNHVPKNYTETLVQSKSCPDEIKYDCENYDTEDIYWESHECVDCKSNTPPDGLDGNPLPESVYTYGADCSLQCLGLYRKRTEPSQSCVLCNKDCPVGQYLKDEEDCTTCESCESNLGTDTNLEFISKGNLGEPKSCDEQCKSGYYLSISIPVKDIVYECIPHSNQDCPENEILINGTNTENSQCEPCIPDCEGMKEITACDTVNNIQRVCELCTDDLEFGEIFTGTDCTKSCTDNRIRDEDGNCVRCQHTCPVGTKVSVPRANCEDCSPCTNKPSNSEYVHECEWICNDGFEYDTTVGICRKQASVIPVSSLTGRSWYSFSCENHQKWTITGCQDCATDNTPLPSLRNTTWNWKPTRTSCEWECLPGYYSYAFSATTSNCMNWTDYLLQVETIEEVVESTQSAKFSVKLNRKSSVIKEWQLVSILITVIFTSIYVFT